MASSHHNYPSASGLLLVGGVVAFIATQLLLISFASPYWLQSYPETYSNFKRLGLWEVCFDGFRYPRYQYDKKFEGCHYIYSREYRIIQEWILPGWYMFVQAIMSVAFVFSLLALLGISLVLMRYFLRYEIYVLGVSFIVECLAAVPIFLGVAVFGGKCWDRNWLLYPNFNHLSWAYGLAVVSFFLHSFAAVCLFFEIFKAKERKRKMNTLVLKMDSASSFRSKLNGSIDHPMLQDSPAV